MAVGEEGVPGYGIRRGDEGDIEGLKELWLQLHRYHRVLCEGIVPMQSDEDSWHARASLYRGHLMGGIGVLLIAESIEGSPIGYAFIIMKQGPDDSWAFSRWADLYSLILDARYRNRGIGAALLDRAVTESSARGAEALEVSAMTRNEGAIRFYEGHGFKRTETVLFRPFHGVT